MMKCSWPNFYLCPGTSAQYCYSHTTEVQFLPRNTMHKRGLCRHAVSVCLSIRHVRGPCQNE